VISTTTLDESPVFFPARDGTLFGVLTEPRTAERGVAVVVLSGGGTPLSTSVNRISVRLCRDVAGIGFHALRFDYHGVGESAGTTDRFHLAKPFVGDVDAALAFLRTRGIERFALVGSCFGARTALAAAALTLDVEGLVLISPPVRDFEMGERTATRMANELSLRGYAREALRWRNVRKFSHAARRRQYSKLARAKLRAMRRSVAKNGTADKGRVVSGTFVQEFGDVIGRDIQVLVIFGEGDDLWTDFERAPMPIAPPHAEALAVKVLPGAVHGFPDVACQEAVLEGIHRWLEERRTWRVDLSSRQPLG
jgi:pimeloyl-ACP methyl ester carboxylesterase